VAEPVSLVNVATTDNYSDGATLIAPGAASINVHVRNAAVLMQKAVTAGGGATQWLPTNGIFIPPGDRGFVRRLGEPLEGVRFKSAAAGTPAQVSADAS
jgi:hypothetical protein